MGLVFVCPKFLFAVMWLQKNNKMDFKTHLVDKYSIKFHLSRLYTTTFDIQPKECRN